MNIYKLRIVKIKGDYRKDYFLKEYAAGSLDHAFEQARKEYHLNEYNIYLESQRTEMDDNAKEKWFNAIMNKVCYDCG